MIRDRKKITSSMPTEEGLRVILIEWSGKPALKRSLLSQDLRCEKGPLKALDSRVYKEIFSGS